MQAEELKFPQFKKSEGIFSTYQEPKHQQNFHDNLNAQFIYFYDNKSRYPEENYKWNAESEIKTESLRHLQQFISPYAEDKNNINKIVTQKSKCNNDNFLDITKDRTLTQNQLLTKSIIEQTRKTMESTANDTDSQQQTKENQKKIDELISQIESDNSLLMRTLFNYYFQAFSAIQVIIRSKAFQQQKNDEHSIEKERIFEKKLYHLRDYNKTRHEIKLDQIMYPPVVCENDFIYINDPLTNTSRLQLNKSKDIYQTEKPKCMLKLQLAIKELSIIIYKLIEQVTKPKNEEKLLSPKDNIKIQIGKSISQINNYEVSYQTQAILLHMCDYVIDTLESYHPKSQKSSGFSKQQLINIKQNALNYTLEFLSKLSFYNFVVGLYNFFNKRDIPIKIFTSASFGKFEGSFVDMKMEFFSKTIKNPILLMRFFNQSVNHNIARNVSQKIPASKFDMFNFYQIVCSIKSQQEMIDMYILYQYNFMNFGSEMVIDLIDADNLLFKEIFNYSRFLTSNFLGHFLIKTLKIIDNQINQCHTRFFYQRFQYTKENDERWNQSFKKIKERIDFSMKKIYEYLYPPKEKQSNANSKYIRTESQKLLSFFLLINYDKKNKNKTIQEEIEDIKLIYEYVTEIFNKSFFQKDLFRKFYLQLTKNLGIKDWHFSSFLQWNLPKESALRSKQNYDKYVEELLKEYKMGQIIILKLFNMFRTLPLYSFANRIEYEQLKKMDGKSDIIPRNQKQVLNKLDMLFINVASRKRIAIVDMRAKQTTSDFQINKNFEIEYELAKMINELYIKLIETTNQAYLEKALNYENQKFQNYLFIPTKSCLPLKKNKDQTEKHSSQQEPFTTTTKSTQNTLFATKERKGQTKQSVDFFNQIQKHSYFRLLMQKQAVDHHFNFNINWIMNKHIHRNRLSIFPLKLTKQLIDQINNNLLFFSQGHKVIPKEKRSLQYIQQIKYLQSQSNDRLDAFANQTLNKSGRDLLIMTNTNKGNFTKKQIYDDRSMTISMEQKSKTVLFNKDSPYSNIDDINSLKQSKKQ